MPVYGYKGTQDDGEVKYINTLPEAKSESSILFRCVGKDEQKLGTYTDPNTGVEKQGYLPDFTPLQYANKITAGEYATIIYTQ